MSLKSNHGFINGEINTNLSEELRQVCLSYLRYLGFNEDEIKSTYDSLIFAEMHNKPSHGLNRLFSGFIEKCVDSGMMEPNKVPILLESSDDQQLFFNGNHAIGYHGIKLIVDHIIQNSKSNSVTFAHVNNLYPTNALSEYAKELNDHNLICYITTKSPDKVGPPVSPGKHVVKAEAVVGTNAYAWGFPNVAGNHFIFDVSMAGATNGELLQPLENQRKNFLKNNFLTKSLNTPDDPEDLFNSTGEFDGLILPMGGEKNYKSFGNLLIAEYFNLLSEQNSTNTSTTIIAIKNTNQDSRNSNFRDKLKRSLEYQDGKKLKIPFEDGAIFSEEEVLHQYSEDILKLKYNNIPPSNYRLNVSRNSLFEHDLSSYKYNLINSVKNEILRFSDSVPESVIDVALNTDLGNDTFFNEWSKKYSLPSLDQHSRIIDGVKGLTFGPNDLVLDVGCGNGRLIQILPEIRKLVCLDISNAMLDSISTDNTTYPIQKVHSDFLDYSTSESFDKIISIMSMHHISHHDKNTAISKVASLLNNGGVFFLGETFLDSVNIDDRYNMFNIADIYFKKIKNCFSNGVISHGLKDFQILRRILFSDGEYMLSKKQWSELLLSHGLTPVTGKTTSPDIGYGYLVFKKN
ncbi:Ldh family oxidoreductase [Pectobacteriaceae bacterium CE70]|nr:Ldh family oxidoreductase [Pectobacteriaceae bacterium CE70]WJY09460.1 Ldh family oxidoreductase [Pectobacteriaceae bacterium C80]